MELPSKIDEVASHLVKKGADSVFLYGSRARGDHEPGSDWEIGAVFREENYVSRSQLSDLQTDAVVIYPFKLNELQAGTVATPFTRSIWLNEIISIAKTIRGKEIINDIPQPEITNLDIVADSSFYKARALDAMIAQREGHEDLARDLFVKSTILGARALILAKRFPFPSSYPEIARIATPLLNEEVRYLPNRALDIRTNKLNITSREAFDNIKLQMTVEDTARGLF
jgi:predicted nucleotidyltransferase